MKLYLTVDGPPAPTATLINGTSEVKHNHRIAAQPTCGLIIWLHSNMAIYYHGVAFHLTALQAAIELNGMLGRERNVNGRRAAVFEQRRALQACPRDGNDFRVVTTTTWQTWNGSCTTDKIIQRGLVPQTGSWFTKALCTTYKHTRATTNSSGTPCGFGREHPLLGAPTQHNQEWNMWTCLSRPESNN